MAISIADKIYDVTIVLQRQISETLYSYSEVIWNLEANNLFPNLADILLITRLTKFVTKIDGLNQQLRNYGLFDPGLHDYADEVDDLIEELARRFQKWTRRTVITVTDACKKFTRSRSTMYRWIKSGKLIAQKIDGRWLIAQ
jgi:hypothetical protein